MTAGKKLHRLVDEPAGAERAPALMLEALVGAPEDDEPWTAEDEAAAAEGHADLAAGRTISLDEMLRTHG